MSKILELREKRASLWEQTKSFLDSKRNDKGIVSPEDTATYEKMEADVVNLGKEIERLERQAVMDLELSKAVNTPLIGKPNTPNEPKTGRASDEYKNAFWNAMRNKTVYNEGERTGGLRIGVDSEGGILCPDEYERVLIDALNDENIMRPLVNVISSSSGEKKIPVVAGHGTASWVEEEALIPESDDSFGVVNLGAYKLATLIKISEELMNDSFFNIEQYVAKEFARRMGAAEEEAMITGSGTSKPTGILNSAQVGVTSASSTAITVDEIVDLYHSLREPYRRNAVFITNDSTIKAIRKLKDGNGTYLWQPSITAGAPDTILNRPIKTSGYMPALTAGNKVMLFGDTKYYWLSDRQGRTFKRLNELFAQNGQIGFIATQRLDGKLILPEAVKVLQLKA